MAKLKSKGLQVHECAKYYVGLIYKIKNETAQKKCTMGLHR